MPGQPALLDHGRAKALGACSECGGERGGDHRKKYLIKLILSKFVFLSSKTYIFEDKLSITQLTNYFFHCVCVCCRVGLSVSLDYHLSFFLTLSLSLSTNLKCHLKEQLKPKHQWH